MVLLLDLLRIICTDSLKAFKDFYAAHEKLFADFGISHDELLREMKLLSLCSIASIDPLLSFEKIADCLEVHVDDVEMWVVDAIAQGLLEATMDQFNCMVTVGYVITRVRSPCDLCAFDTLVPVCPYPPLASLCTSL